MSGETLNVIRSGDEIKVGSYFVSNYPPYSFWGPEQVDRARAAPAARE